jgi:hypothetical protein
MDCYVFQAALICEDCCDALKANNAKPDYADESDESTYDSDDWPKGPYGDGGGEADCPQHCDKCGVFLDNPLTGDGESYVRDAFREFVELGRGAIDVLAEWKAAYSYVWDDFESITFADMVEDGEVSDLMQRRFDELESN